jgi:proteasome lid subunit RPN8/RPN11
VSTIACAYDTDAAYDTETGEEEVAEESAPLYDSSDQHWTGRLALREAQRLTVAGGSRFEYCGLVVRKANGQYRAGYPTTSWSRTYCGATITLYAGESVVGYYHTHPAGVTPYFSPEDFNSARTQRRHYYLAGSDGCGYRYDPFTNTAWHMGCPF